MFSGGTVQVGCVLYSVVHRVLCHSFCTVLRPGGRAGLGATSYSFKLCRERLKLEMDYTLGARQASSENTKPRGNPSNGC